MNPEHIGITAKEALERLTKDAPNAIQELKKHPVIEFLAKFWSPIINIATTYCDSRFGLGNK